MTHLLGVAVYWIGLQRLLAGSSNRSKTSGHGLPKIHWNRRPRDQISNQLEFIDVAKPGSSTLS